MKRNVIVGSIVLAAALVLFALPRIRRVPEPSSRGGAERLTESKQKTQPSIAPHVSEVTPPSVPESAPLSVKNRIATTAERSTQNIAMDRLIATRPFSRRELDQLIRQADDPNEDLVIRDYAIQHIGRVPIAELTEADQAHARAALLRALDEPRASIAGTALLALQNHQRILPGADAMDKLIAEHALRIANAATHDPASRATALHIACVLDWNAARHLALEQAIAGPNLTARASATAAIGQSGGAAELELLRTLAQEERNRPMMPALQTAINRLVARLEQQDQTTQRNLP